VLPILDVAGPARERGQAHGEALRGTIRHGLELWAQHTQRPPGTEVDVGRPAYLEAARRWTPDALEELHGIAEGARVSFAAIFELNLADERRIFGCSSAGLRSGVPGAPVSGQTMDTPVWFADLRTAVRAAEAETGLTTVAFTIAGMPALCGINSAGVSVWCNALSQLPSSARGVPVSCIARHLLSCRTLAEARTFVETVPHASGQHYLLGAPDGIVSLECSARSVVEAREAGAAVWHANHPVAGGETPDRSANGNSQARDSFMAAALGDAGSVEDLLRIFEDRTVPVCKLGDGRGDGYTLWAVVVEHSAPPSVLASAGPPEHGSWIRVPL
jgi:isopenicillin-N N-acyltransferase like protein